MKAAKRLLAKSTNVSARKQKVQAFRSTDLPSGVYDFYYELERIGNFDIDEITENSAIVVQRNPVIFDARRLAKLTDAARRYKVTVSVFNSRGKVAWSIDNENYLFS